MTTIWSNTTDLYQHETLSGNMHAEVAVIGGGLAGILTAYYLTQQGKHVIVLEANRVGSGQSGHTTAKITSQHNLIYDKLIRTVGITQAKQYASANQAAIEEYKQLINRLSIDCHFEELPSYLYSTREKEALICEEKAAIKLGIKAKFVNKISLPFSVAGALRFPDQAQFNPLQFLNALASKLTIYENTRVLSVKDSSLVTDHGTISANAIVFACHYPFINFPGFYFTRMYQERSYVLALTQASQLDGMYLGIDSDGYSFRAINDTLLFGGQSHRTGKAPMHSPYEVLRNTAKTFWPNSVETAHWSAEDCMTLDHIPYIGPFSASTPNWYVATGFGKWGMTHSMISANIISELILGRKKAYSDVFSPQRFHAAASFKEGSQHILESSKGLILGHMPKAPRCSHLGCRLTFNSADQSFDCPCHGSRYDQNGSLLDGPAQDDISFID